MAKYRIQTKNSMVMVKSRLAHKEQVNEREIEQLVRHAVNGLFHISYDGKKQIIYQAPLAVSLEKYLKGSRLQENSFWRILSQMIDIVLTIENMGLYPTHLLMEKNAIFIKEDTLEMFFVYQPIISAEMSANIFAVIHDIVYQEIKKGGGMQQEYLFDFQNYLLQGNYDLRHVRQYIDQAAPWTRVQGSTEHAGSALEMPSVRQVQDVKPVQIPDQYTMLLGESGEEEATMLEPGIGVRPPGRIVIKRMKENEQAELSGDVLHLGRSIQNDYCIPGNGSVGRKHAALEWRGDAYYLKDLGSMNGTCLNGIPVGSDEACRLKDGDRMRLADEEFLIILE